VEVTAKQSQSERAWALRQRRAGARSQARAATKDQLRQSGTLEKFQKIAGIITEHRESIFNLSANILDFRSGYRFDGGWITDDLVLILGLRQARGQNRWRLLGRCPS
jgi:hypothetical protein